MEYYILVTKSCNMQCKYCVGSDIVFTKSNCSNDKIDIQGISNYLINESKNYPNEKLSVVFYGGEPLLNQKAIIELINRTKKIAHNFSLYTNGLLLDKIDEYLLQNIRHIFVSFDGIRELHNYYRKDNTFDKILENVKSLKRKYKGNLIARITLMPESDIYRAVNNCLEICDAVFWQQASIANSFSCEDQEKYQMGIDKLVSSWLENMKNGKIQNIIPFQSIVGSYLTGEKKNSLRCGCGSTLKVVNSNGDLYSCDEMIRLKKGIIGNIYNGSNPIKISTVDLEGCRECEVNEICGGRCLFSHSYYPKDKNKFYCENTKHLINSLVDKSECVRVLIEKGIVALDEIRTFESMNCTEEIP